MWKIAVILCITLTLASARPERGPPRSREREDDYDWGYGRPPPPPGRGRGPPPGAKEMGDMTRMMMKQMKGALMDFIGAAMYGDHIFKKMTVIMTPDEHKKYAECAKADFQKMKDHKDIELTPMEREFVMDRHLGVCMLKARFGYDDEKVDKLECCSIRAYMHELINSGRRRGPKHISTPPGFRMVQAEFGCFMNLTYGFSIEDLKKLKGCMLQKEGVTDESTAQKLLKLFQGEDGPEQEEKEYKKGIRLPTEEDVEKCLKEAKPSMADKDAKDVAFVNTKKRALAAAKAEDKEKKIEAAKRLLHLLEKAQ